MTSVVNNHPNTAENQAEKKLEREKKVDLDLEVEVKVKELEAN